MLLYTSEWQPSHGGQLRMLDEDAKVWREVSPRADHVVIFRSDRVLHKVMPCYEQPRLALSIFLSEGATAEQAEFNALLAALTSSV
jgi:Rps23 Pro-64 3,4-dihydroxylase Tpa1-like proline 4-hydroxylase